MIIICICKPKSLSKIFIIFVNYLDTESQEDSETEEYSGTTITIIIYHLFFGFLLNKLINLFL